MDLYAYNLQFYLLNLWVLVTHATNTPTLGLIQLYYPGYMGHGGNVSDSEIVRKIGNVPSVNAINTSSLRLSYALNQISDEHTLGNQPIAFPEHGRISFTGTDNFEYIYNVVKIGVYLTAKYGNPAIIKPIRRSHKRTMKRIMGRQGIVRMLTVTDGNHVSGHIALWDCDRFYQIRDYSRSHHIISLEFWESEGSKCPGQKRLPIGHPSAKKLHKIMNDLYRHKHKSNHHGNHHRRHHYMVEKFPFSDLL